MIDINTQTAVDSEDAIMDIGSFLIDRYLNRCGNQAQREQCEECPDLLRQLEALLTVFLDQSSPKTVDLVKFTKNDDDSVLIDFNGSFRNTLHAESLLRDFFEKGTPHYELQRGFGPATDRLILMPQGTGTQDWRRVNHS